jgi:hypothetical protein
MTTQTAEQRQLVDEKLANLACPGKQEAQGGGRGNHIREYEHFLDGEFPHLGHSCSPNDF